MVRCSVSMKRFAFQQSMKSIYLIPYLHHSTIRLIGMEKDLAKIYLTYKVIDDKIHALNIRNELSTWCTYNGKIVKILKLKG